MIVNLTEKGKSRVLDGQTGMTFLVDSQTKRDTGEIIVHVRDYRFSTHDNFQIWTLSPEHYKVIEL